MKPARNPVVTIHQTTRYKVEIQSMPPDRVIAMVEALRHDDVLTFDLAEGKTQIHVPRHAIARIDVDWEPGVFARAWYWVKRTYDGLVH